MIKNPSKAYTYDIVIDPKLKLKHNLIIKKIVDTLNDRRSWRKFGYTFTLVAPATNTSQKHITIMMSPNETIKRICKFDGLSCADYSTNIAHLNLEKWQKGCTKSKLPLQDYRTYVILHEVGHLLGKDHVDFANYKNTKAPVMVPQTLGIGECKPNCWPLKGED